MSRFARSSAFGLALAAGGGLAANCPSGLAPYMAEESPFGWPLAPNEWQFAHPECWAEKYPLCAGERQSPMNIDLTLTTADCTAMGKGSPGALADKANYKILAGKPEVSISSYMRSAALKGELGTITLKDAAGKDVEYEATSAHLTAGSLHSINGMLADAELLVVHKPKGAPNGLSNAVIVSVLFRAGEGSSALFTQMGFSNDNSTHETGSVWKATESVDLHSAIYDALTGTSYSYSGSVPVPPCSESVHYFVLSSEQPVGAAQVAKLKETLVRHTGGFMKRPPVSRAPNGICRAVIQDSAVVTEPARGCAEASDKVSACWATTCDKSPVDINASSIPKSSGVGVSASDLVMYKPTSNVTMKPSMYTLDAYGEFGQILLNGRVFVAKKLSIKAISQHTFDGKHYAGELTVEHELFGDSLSDEGHRRRLEVEETPGSEEIGRAPVGGQHRVVLSVPLKIGTESALLRNLGLDVEAHTEAISHGNSYDVHSTIDLAAALLPSTSQTWYWYSGGPTTPGACPDWGVKWLVMETPLEVSLAQLNSLHLPVSGVDSTVTAKAIEAYSITRSSVPMFALKLGTCSSSSDFHIDPTCWAATNPVCGSGMAQSPINIDTASVSQVGSESFLAKASWKPVSGLRLSNDGNSLGFESSQMGYSTLTGSNGFPKYYQITSVALRMPSEHLIDGKQYPAELQITHKNQKTVLELEDDDALITSVMFDFGEENKLLKQMLETIPAAGSHVTLEQPVDLQWALGPAIDGPFFKYEGSYTTPDCAEDASWAVFETPMTLSMEQWKAFKAAFPNPGNNRPVQPLNGRTIAKNTMEEPEAVNYRYFLNREFGHDKRETNPALILFPIIGTILLCTTVMTATFQREDPGRKRQSAGGLEEKPTTLGRVYNPL